MTLCFKEKTLADCKEKASSKVRINLKPRLPLPLSHVYWPAYNVASEDPSVMGIHFQQDLAL